MSPGIPVRSGPRVALVLEQLWHRVPGGTATAALGSARALLAHTDLRLVGVAAAHLRPPPPPWVPPVPVAHLGLGRRALYEAWHRARRPSVQAATGGVDVVHATGMAVPPADAPLVVTLNDLAWRHDPSHFSAMGRHLFEGCLRLAATEADVVAVPSLATRDDAVAAGVPDERLVLVPYGHEAPLASEAEVDATLATRGIGRSYLVWVGTLEPRKNLPVVLEAHRRARRARPDLELVLVGPAGWGDIAESVPGSPSEGVHVTGFVDDAELRALYRGAQLLCYPSLREGFGLPVLEAMAQGTPVVTSAGTSTEEVLGPDGGAGRAVDPTDAGAVADAVEDLLEPDRRRRAAALASAQAARFSWERTAAALAGAYDQARTGRPEAS